MPAAREIEEAILREGPDTVAAIIGEVEGKKAIISDDIIDTAGILTTGNSRTRERHVPVADATVVERLKVAGAVLLGKQTDFTLKFAAPPAVNANCRFIVMDADIKVLRQSIATLKAGRVLASHVADAPEGARTLIAESLKNPLKTNTYKISFLNG